jgi:hypothetical protein
LSLLIKKTFWPAAIVVGFLVFLGAAGQGFSLRQAEAGTTEAICGPEVIQEDVVTWYIAVFSDLSGEDEATWDLMTGPVTRTSPATLAKTSAMSMVSRPISSQILTCSKSGRGTI